MDNQPASPIIIQNSQMPSPQKLWPNLQTASLPRVVFILLILVIIGELIWGGWYLLKPSNISKNQVSSQKTNAITPSAPAAAKISLITNQTNIKVGDKVIVDVLISTNNRNTTGTDLAIDYDPNFLSISKDDFVKGSIYDEYLGQSVNKKGIYRVSGLNNSTSKSASDGKFGTLTFKSLAAGNAKITVEYKPNVSTDSNVIDAKLSKDILDSVDNIEVNIK